MRINLVIVFLFLSCFSLKASSVKFEGILGQPIPEISNMNGYARYFIPHNPIIVEIGAYKGKGTLQIAARYPYGTIYAFEAHPDAHNYLKKNTAHCKNIFTFNLAINSFTGAATLWGDAENASLLHLNKGEGQVKVDSIVLDDWCKEYQLEHIDFLRLDAGGMEYQILESSSEILKTVLVVVTKTYILPSHSSIVSFKWLKYFLENQGFVLLAHWYKEGKEGEAVFVRKYMYDSLFR